MSDILAALAATLEERKTAAAAENSYVAQLHTKGLNKILEKVGEEATETLLAAKDAGTTPTADNKQALIGETADLWFHSMVMLSHLNIDVQDVLSEMERRFGLSGIEEKASRNNS